MLRNRPLILILAMVVSFGVIALSGCAPVEEPRGPVATNSESGKIPVTTASEEARKEFLHGRDLSEKLLIQDSIQYFDRAIALDPNFAIAELNRANVSPTGKEFFEHLKKAVALSDRASNGERLLILGNEAGANGNAAKQKEYLDQLVAAYPNDERAHFNPAATTSANRRFQRRLSIIKRRRILHRTTRLLTTFSVTPTGRTRTTPMLRRHSRNTSS